LEREKKKVEKASRKTHLTVKLTTVLAWFLFRRRLPPTWPKRRTRKKHLPSEKCPALASLPSKILDEVINFNKVVFEQFQGMAWSVASTRKIGEKDTCLPFSSQQFSTSWDSRGQPFAEGSVFEKRLQKQMIRYRSRSPFVAMCGFNDTYNSLSDFVKYTRPVLHLTPTLFPMIAPAMHDLESLEPSNSWAVDFLMHGKIKCLCEDNGFSPARAYKLLISFRDAVKMILDAVKRSAPADDIVVSTLEALLSEMNHLLKDN
jgi:hypothetical protein